MELFPRKNVIEYWKLSVWTMPRVLCLPGMEDSPALFVSYALKRTRRVVAPLELG